MKSYLLLAFTFTVAQALTHGFTGTSLSNVRRSDLIGQRSPIYTSQRYGYSGRPEYSETLHAETGNFYGGQRDGRFITRRSDDNVRGLQYSLRPGQELSRSSGGQFGSLYNQQSRFQDQNRRDNLRYGAGRGQVTFSAPLANTRSYNTQFDGPRSQNFGYY